MLENLDLQVRLWQQQGGALVDLNPKVLTGRTRDTRLLYGAVFHLETGSFWAMGQFEVLGYRCAMRIVHHLQNAPEAASELMYRLDAAALPMFGVAFAPHKMDLKNGEWVSTAPGAHGRTDFYVVASFADRKVAVMHIYHTTNYDAGTYSNKCTSCSSRLLVRDLVPVAQDRIQELAVETEIWNLLALAWQDLVQAEIHWCSGVRRSELHA